jgi:hypothetical protein
VLTTSYILPIKSARPVSDELVEYVRAVSSCCELIIVDGSSEPVFEDFAARCGALVRHVAPDPQFRELLNGKAAGALTGVWLASHERVVIADEDVRYERQTLEQVTRALDHADVVRPQNYFDPQPWHAYLDTGRILINRMSGGDWPGTLAVRRSTLQRAGGYRADVLFENLELVRTIVAAGGRECIAYDLFVRRRPPSTRHFLSQRVRQAYDEFARPVRMAMWLAVLPLLYWRKHRGGWGALRSAGMLAIVCAEIGRRRAGGQRVFPFIASLLAPLWILERAMCAWLAIGARLVLGGVPYRGRIMPHAATPMKALVRHQHSSSMPSSSPPR